LDTGLYLFASAKNILPYVLHTYLPISSGNTIPSYPPAPLIFPSFCQSSRGLQEPQKILPASTMSCFGLSPLAYSTGEGALQHRPLVSFGSSPFAMLAIVRLICACVRLEKPTPVWCACHIWRVPSPLISPLWTATPGVPWSPPSAVPHAIGFSLHLPTFLFPFTSPTSDCSFWTFYRPFRDLS